MAMTRRQRLLAGILAMVGVVAIFAGLTRGVGMHGEWPHTDFSRHTLALSEIRSGGPSKDGIPPIDHPRYDTIEKATSWLLPDEPVIVVEESGVARAYPLQVLVWHEIVNDTLNGRPISVTFCPLCNTSIAYDRKLGDKVLDFGTTGRLRKSNMVMYDRQSESWWQQFTGDSIVGKYAGQRLRRIPARVVAFSRFAEAWPDGDVLSRNTGYMRHYGENPYRGYDRIGENPFLFDDPVDPRLPAMERVLGISVDNTYRIYPFSILSPEKVINDRVAGKPVVVFASHEIRSMLGDADIRYARQVPAAIAYASNVKGRVLDFVWKDNRIKDQQTGTVWDIFGRAVSGPLEGDQLPTLNSGVHFAFAWLAFRPDSSIYTENTLEASDK